MTAIAATAPAISVGRAGLDLSPLLRAVIGVVGGAMTIAILAALASFAEASNDMWSNVSAKVVGAR